MFSSAFVVEKFTLEIAWTSEFLANAKGVLSGTIRSKEFVSGLRLKTHTNDIKMSLNGVK